MRIMSAWAAGLAILLGLASAARADDNQKIVDVPTRPGVTQRLLMIAPPDAKAAIILIPGGHGGLQLQPNGDMRWGEGNFVVRTRQMFARSGLVTALLDAPSDRQEPPFLQGFRQRPEHAADLKAVIAWLRETYKVPVWLVGTSRGTQSAGYVATELAEGGGPDGVVLTSTILSDDKGRPVTAMPLERIKVPVLVVQHEADGCPHCKFSDAPTLMAKLSNASRKQLLAVKGGTNQGDPCEAKAYHGFNGLDSEVVPQIAAWILAK